MPWHFPHCCLFECLWFSGPSSTSIPSVGEADGQWQTDASQDRHWQMMSGIAGEHSENWRPSWQPRAVAGVWQFLRDHWGCQPGSSSSAPDFSFLLTPTLENTLGSYQTRGRCTLSSWRSAWLSPDCGGHLGNKLMGGRCLSVSLFLPNRR